MSSDTIMRAADGTPLKAKLAQSLRREQLRAMALIAPLLIFILASFLLPILMMLKNAVYDPDLQDTLPRTSALLATWDGKALPEEPVFEAFAAELKAAQKERNAALIGKRLNYELPAMKSKVTVTARKLEAVQQGPWKEALTTIDPVWGDIETWATVKHASSTFTPFYLLSALDLRQTAEGAITAAPAERQIYRQIIMRTFLISTLVTVLTLLLGFPVAYFISMLPPHQANLLLVFILLPFWTSLLVRTTAWSILFQDGGVITQFLHVSGITWLLNALGLLHGEPALFKTRLATVIAMTHIQLPFTLLPIYSVMKTISPNYMRAARSLGATPVYAFIKVYLPQTLPGIAAGCLLTFILSLGYYITPALVGGPTDSMIAGFIDTSMNNEGNWGKASALGAILFTATLVLYYVYNRLVGIDKLKLG
ncbi:MAG: ABC transporter permease [Alphaproteobacteria bacterium]|nr:ABC transporter permease [Alphaproteobacteria bacterium]